MNDILSIFKDFSGSIGAKTVLSNFMPKLKTDGIKEVRRIQNEYDALVKSMLQTKDPAKLTELRRKYYQNRADIKNIMNQALAKAYKY